MMKLCRFDRGRVGLIIDGRVYDVTEYTGLGADFWPPVGVNRLIRDFDRVKADLDRVLAGPSLSESEVRFEAPVPWPNKLIAIPVNYHAHQVEMSSPAISRDAGFFVLANSSFSGPSDPIVLPDLPNHSVHHEAELAVIIGRGGRHISRADALGHVFGYSCLIDVTVRGKQERAIRKSFDTFTPVGPWITTADEVGDPGALQVTLWVNGGLRQDANTSSMILDVPAIIEMCSSVMTLEPGDVIATGTAEGVGPISAGDSVDIEISRVGKMSVPVVQGKGGSSVAIPKH